MKKLLSIALLAVSFSAAAAQPLTVTADPATFVHGQYTFRDSIAGQSDDPNRNGVNLTVGRNVAPGIVLDGGVQFRTENGEAGRDSTRLEAGATYQRNLTQNVAFYTRGALGYKLTDADDSTYYSVEPGLNFHVTQPLHVRVGYRYRDAFNNDIFDKTNTVRVGAEYALDKTQAVTLGIDRAYGDSEFLGVNVGYAVKF